MSAFLIFTDLDGTFLDHDTYSWEAARPAVRILETSRIPWVFLTSKTRAEVEFWREQTGNRHPFIVENGAAAFIPAGYFAAPVPGAVRRGDYDVIEWGVPYDALVAALREASGSAGCRVRGFAEMTIDEVAEACGLPFDQARLAKQREYDEPFVVLDPEHGVQLSEAIAAKGLFTTRGGRFWHIVGRSDKGAALRAVEALYRNEFPSLRTIGLGDGLNDVPFLKEVEVPVIMRSPRAEQLRELLPGASMTNLPGPAGWAEAVIRLTQTANS